MSEQSQIKQPRERSPSFPIFSLKVAFERLRDFEAKFGRHPAPYATAGIAWGMEKGSSQANRFLAAIKAFGLIRYEGSGENRQVLISDDGRKYLLAQQQSIKDEIAKAAALKPKAIAKFWPKWGTDRPPNELCLDELVLNHSFTKVSAPQFLNVYDETIAYAGLCLNDKVEQDDVSVVDDEEDHGVPTLDRNLGIRNIGEQKTKLQEPPATVPMNGERVLTTGILARNASFKLIVTGRVGPKELDRLIRKLELDKEILAESVDES